MRLAAVDVGSNTVQAVVADVSTRGLREVARHVEMPGLGARVERTGSIGDEKMREALTALTSVLDRARQDGAEDLAIGATAAVRRASDGEAFCAGAGLRAGKPVHLLSEEVEARLAFLGVASRHASAGRWLMADVGGASTELVMAEGETVLDWLSLGLGSGVLADRLLSDPPHAGERRAVRGEAIRLLAARPLAGAERLVATGGTVLHLPAVIGTELEAGLGAADLARAARRLDATASAELGEQLRLPAARVRALRAGVEILSTLLDRAALERAELSREGLPHGMILALHRHGEDWHRITPG
ncbi:MAG: hypothetical protein ACREPA_02855 [Candidatus Dormibacteraceae bacterium]